MLRKSQPDFSRYLKKIEAQAKKWFSYKKKTCILTNFAKFRGKHLCRSLFFNEGLKPATLLKERHHYRCFPVNFAKFLRKCF